MKEKKNFLDLIPQISKKIEWDDSDVVTLKIYHKGFFHRIAHQFFDRPDVSYIHLDKYGGFVWKHIDGNKSVYEIANLLKAEFSDEIEPLYERLSEYMKVLHNNKFIEFVQ